MKHYYDEYFGHDYLIFANEVGVMSVYSMAAFDDPEPVFSKTIELFGKRDSQYLLDFSLWQNLILTLETSAGENMTIDIILTI